MLQFGIADRFPHRDAAPVVPEHMHRLIRTDRIGYGNVITGHLGEPKVTEALGVGALARSAIVNRDQSKAVPEQRRNTVP
ncbi:Uncharacterised protein [Mycobacteroides abscessus subsp. abscessus]|nr:Uncharacterised protein [Mycobacteroides abscessus subsp. abscessus]